MNVRGATEMGGNVGGEEVRLLLPEWAAGHQEVMSK